MYVYMCVYMCVYIYMCAHVYMYRVHVCIHVDMHVCTCDPVCVHASFKEGLNSHVQMSHNLKGAFGVTGFGGIMRGRWFCYCFLEMLPEG